MIPMNGDAIYYDDHHLHDDDVGGGESISVFDDIWEGGCRYPLTLTNTDMKRSCRKNICTKIFAGNSIPFLCVILLWKEDRPTQHTEQQIFHVWT